VTTSVGPGAGEGVLYGVGVGPGDPGLITIKAVRILSEVDEIFTASSSSNEDSLAARIASPHLRPGATIRKLGFPMTADQAVLSAAWEDNARQVAATLRAGRSAAFLTLGDCLTYSTYAYLLQHLRRVMPEARVESVPGVASYQLAAARLNRPLVLGRESLAILGGSTGGPDEEAVLAAADNLAILKSYRDTPAMLAKLKALGLADRTALCANLALPGETVVDGVGDLKEPPKSYFTLMLVNKRPRD
jgi:precorrin-2/cobalt-factor-2 C20-methyltransferase